MYLSKQLSQLLLPIVHCNGNNQIDLTGMGRAAEEFVRKIEFVSEVVLQWAGLIEQPCMYAAHTRNQADSSTVWCHEWVPGPLPSTPPAQKSH